MNTTKTRRTLATLDTLGGVPTVYAAPIVLVPNKAWEFYEVRVPIDEKWAETRPAPGLVFKLNYSTPFNCGSAADRNQPRSIAEA